MTTTASETDDCGQAPGGGWRCFPRDCNRPREACVMEHVWDLYKPRKETNE